MLRVDESGNYSLSFSVTDASTGASVWNGALGMAPAPAPAVAAPAQGGVADLPPGPPPAPTFVGNAAKTRDERLNRGIESVGYHPPRSPKEDVRPARNRGTPQDRGFLGRSSIRFGGAVDFLSVHDFHHCRAGRGGNGFASGTIDLRINFADFSDSPPPAYIESLRSLDFVAHTWYKVYLDDPYAGLDNPREEVGETIVLDDLDSYGADLRLQWSFAPGEWFNPYLGAGVELSRTSVALKVQSSGYWYIYDEDDEYCYSGWLRRGKYSTDSNDVCWLLEAGLEFNLGSRLSLRGDFTYFRESTKDDGYWADSSRRLFSAEACLRLTDRQFLSIGASYETKDKFRSVNVGYGVSF